AVIEHECRVGKFSHISVGSKLCGNVKIGNDTMVGAGSVIIQGIEIGDDVIIGAGSTVVVNVKRNSIKYGLIKG
ncbi:MAG: acetyltransferase, partial [Treponema sp.]|nr:acetyltransferase [Treponema sp.]